MRKNIDLTRDQVQREIMKRSPLMRARGRVAKKIKKEELKRRRLMEKVREITSREAVVVPGLGSMMAEVVRSRDQLCWDVIEREIASLAAINGRVRAENIFRV